MWSPSRATRRIQRLEWILNERLFVNRPRVRLSTIL